MRKVVTIELTGHLYQLDEQGYDQLHAYLDHAEARLDGDPGKVEIVRDLEQSIGEKLLKYLGPEKSVVAADEVGRILQEIGPVVGADAGPDERQAQGQGTATDSANTGAAASPSRLYLVQDGAVIGGLCNGMAVYFHLDPTLVRIGFVVSALIEMIYLERPPVLTGGLYVALMFLVPYDKPSSEQPAGSGKHESIPRKVRRGIERIKAAFGGLPHTAR